MELGRHLEKGLWAFADKALPPVYGVLFMLLVIRILPVEEYGSYLLFQTVFLLIGALANSLAIQPMLKYVAEGMDSVSTSSSVLIILTLFIGICVAIIFFLGKPLANLLDAHYADKVNALFVYLPALFAVTIYRFIASGLLQARFQIKRLFIVDATSLGLSLVLILLARANGLMTNAQVLVHIALISSLVASVVAFFLSRHIAIPSFRWHPAEGRKILDYGKFSLGSTVGSVVQTQFDTFFVSAYGGVSGVAMYGAAKNFTRLFDMYSQGIQMLVVPASSMLQGRQEEHKLPALVEKSMCFSFYAILPAILLFVVFPAPLFNLMYGDKYLSGIPILRILAITGFIIPWGAVIAGVLSGLGKTGTAFIMSVSALFLSAVLYTYFGSIAGIYGIVWAVVCVYGILGTIGILVLRHFVPFTIASIFRRSKDILSFLKNREWLSEDS
jgi:O-antigen/teichoic acid export membrane protein